MDISFSVYNKDILMAEVEIHGENINVKRHAMIPGLQPFGCLTKPVTMEVVNDFIESRCFERGRADKDELLHAMGLKMYDPWEIVKITHGRVWDDFTWIKFPGENLSWKDVSNGRV